MKRTFTLLLLLSTGLVAQAQTPTYTSLAGSGGNAFPFNSNSSNKLQGIYTPANFNTLPPSGYISSVFFRVGTTFTATTQIRTSTDVRIAMGYVPVIDFSGTTTFFTGLDTVYYVPTRTYTALVSGDWVEFPLQTPFYYDNTLNLLVQGSTANTASNQGFTIRNASLANKRLYGLYSATTGTANTNLGEMGFTMTPLAVNLTKFEGSHKNGLAHLSWTTASEHDAEHFEIERSYDGRIFTTITKVSAKGKASDYNYTDREAALSGTLYYRMRIVDLDKSITMSKTVMLKPATTGVVALTMHPNPTEGALTITLPVQPKGAVEVMVADNKGKVLISKAYTTTNATVSFRDMEPLPAGLYFITVVADGESYKDKVVKR